MKHNATNVTGKTKESKPKLRIIIFGSLLIFIILILSLLWLAQTVFLNDLYESTKKVQIRNVVTEIAKDVEKGDIEDLIIKKSSESDTSIALVNNSSGKVMYALQNRDAFLPINSMPKEQFQSFCYKAIENGGEYEEVFSGFGKRNASDGKTASTYIYAKVIDKGPGAQYTVITGAQLTPIDATVSTIKKILLVAGAFIIVLGIILSLLLTHLVSKPITSIAEKARNMPDNLNKEITAGGYKEAQDLADSLNLARIQIGKTDSMQKDLIANISHDLRTPLTLINGYAQMMIDLPEEMNTENLQLVIDETNRLSSLVSEVLDSAKLHNGVIALNKEDVNVYEEILSFTQRYNRLISKDGFSLIFENRLKSNDTVINVDKSRFEQVIYNLVNNAVSFTGEEKCVTITVSDTDSGKVRIDVIDSGEGIPEDVLPDIWERYYKFSSVRHKRNRIGSGLGLSIVKEILTLHGATFGVKSELGKGSDFYFEI